MGRIKWLLLVAVCGAHFALIGSFLHAGKSGQPAENSASRLTLQIVNRNPSEPQEPIATSAPSRIQPTAIPQEKATSEPPAPSSVKKKTDVIPQKSEKPSNEPYPFFNRDRFLDAGELDQSAAASKPFEEALDKALPKRFESIVLEFLIDENGETVQLSCIEGDCSAELSERLQQLMLIPFIPASKNGQAVASRKVIEVFPTPTFGF